MPNEPRVVFSVRLPGGPVIPFDEHTDLAQSKIDVLRIRLQRLRAAYNARVLENADLRLQITALHALCDEMAAELEMLYACQDQGATALAALATEEVRDEQDR